MGEKSYIAVGGFMWLQHVASCDGNVINCSCNLTQFNVESVLKVY